MAGIGISDKVLRKAARILRERMAKSARGTGNRDRIQIESDLRRIYMEANLAVPQGFFWFDSPMGAIYFLKSLGSFPRNGGELVNHETWGREWKRGLERLGPETGKRIGEQACDAAKALVWSLGRSNDHGDWEEKPKLPWLSGRKSAGKAKLWSSAGNGSRISWTRSDNTGPMDPQKNPVWGPAQSHLFDKASEAGLFDRGAQRYAGLRESQRRLWRQVLSGFRKGLGQSWERGSPGVDMERHLNKLLGEVRESLGKALTRRALRIFQGDGPAEVDDRDLIDMVRFQATRETGGGFPLESWSDGRGVFDLDGLEANDFLMRIAGKGEDDFWMRWVGLSRSGVWWWPFHDMAILIEPPLKVARNEEGEIHHEKQAAVIYRDGWGVHAWKGMCVDEWVITQPEKITVPKIEGEFNLEIRRVLIDRFGLGAYLEQTGVRPIHRDRYGTLYLKEIAWGRPMVVVKVRNSTPEPDGSFKDYFLRVPPSVRTAKAAVAWTFGLEEAEYGPEVET